MHVYSIFHTHLKCGIWDKHGNLGIGDKHGKLVKQTDLVFIVNCKMPNKRDQRVDKHPGELRGSRGGFGVFSASFANF